MLFDGIANTASVFSGRARGRKNNTLMKNCWKQTFFWGIIATILITIVFVLFNRTIIEIFTKLPNILILTQKYSIWLVLYPSIAFLGLTFYGVFTGSAKTFPIMTSTVIAFILFLYLGNT